ncbi:xanthine dehydrogenase family protein molybdopterin-binding subunit [Oceanicola sp. D3]|uniref:xanthine dehydrogenase family protein molybdopterin-binding subunit n=1 Tax=Oceanicola sp. D3 TaxID=2587163 RepID=UPI0011241A3F|nr:xanthine dehydrogenase family protein molybdopterin-binding subunit [Oceanicola sp. D3]QDC09058.1 xanthine dehydrogenase family protein molybdopterin-binding subunit [Oceanicola sp. D3]
MNAFGKSQSLKRVEDQRFLTGHGQYLEDTVPEGALFAHFLRSPVGHGKLVTLGLEEAREMPGVKLVAGAAEMKADGVDLLLEGARVANVDGSKGADAKRPVLVEERMRFVGDPIAVVIAETPEQAKDAAEAIELDFEELPAHMELAPGGEPMHEEAPDNMAYHWAQGDEETTDAALAASKHRVKLEIVDNRVMIVSMEPRGAWAEWADGRIHLCFSGQGVWGQKASLARHLGLAEENVRVTHPDVGGGFGLKGQEFPEHCVVAWAAKYLDHPVRWMSERGEGLQSDHGGRDLVSIAELGFDENLKITAYKCENRSNMGAYNSGFGQYIQSFLFARVFPGTYQIQTAYLGCKGYYTNTAQMDAYRGAGRPEAIFVLERMMDEAARQLGVSPWELRRKNFIAADQFPYKSVSGELYDVGDFHAVLADVEKAADLEGYKARKAESEANGKLRGYGLAYYIESILGDPTEGATVEFAEDGMVDLMVGTQSNGQGHETVYAAFLEERSGIPVEKIRVVQGDSDRIATGGGTGGSRSVTTQTNATIAAVNVMVEAFAPFVAEELGVDEVEFEDGSFGAPGSNRRPTMIDAAEMAREKGREDLLRHEGKATLDGRSYPNGGHFCEVEVDPETGQVELKRYTVVDDFGNLVNPTLAEGQVHGGVAQGVGQILMENAVYDEDGQLLTGSFMDYAMPRAADLPFYGFEAHPVPSIQNPLGMKGCGEAGTVGAMAAVTNAVIDALWDKGVRNAQVPFTPQRVWALLKEAEGDAS